VAISEVNIELTVGASENLNFDLRPTRVFPDPAAGSSGLRTAGFEAFDDVERCVDCFERGTFSVESSGCRYFAS
jgi:hypothetical protein